MKLVLKIASLFLLIGLTMQLQARTAPIYNVENALIENQSKLSLQDVTNAIIAAGSGLGWQMSKISDGKISASIYLRKHVATVNIDYTTSQYNITYVESTNLNYDESKYLIHKNYNGWVQNLERAIRTTLDNYTPSK